MTRLPLGLALLLACHAATARAQLTPPTVLGARPVGAAPGEAVALEVRGTDLGGATALRFETAGVRVEGLGATGETVRARVTPPADAPPGPLRFRVVTPRGLSNPGVLYAGRALPTVAEAEPNNGFRRPQTVAAGAAVEGEIKPGDDVDVFAVEMKAGEVLAAEAVASRAGSGLDPLLTVFGPDGRELASDDDAFGKDAAVAAPARASGRYLVQVQDANGRNRDGAVEQKITRPYRLELGRIPLAASASPPGLRRGTRTGLRLTGANLGPGPFFVDLPADAPVGDRVVRFGGSNGLTLRVGDGPEVAEVEPNDEAPGEAQAVAVPGAVNGGFAPRRGGDVDVFRLRAAPGREGVYRVTALAARFGSPADPVLTVLDAKGDPQGEDDDALGRDARVERRVDSVGGLLVAVRDYYGRGGPRFAYRLEVEPVAPRGLTVTADLGGRTVPRGGSVALPLAVLRRDFDGPVTVLAGPLPDGVSATPVTLPKGVNAGLLIVSAGPNAPAGPFPLRLTTRDAPAGAEFLFREPTPARAEPVAPNTAALCVAEPAGLSARVEPADLVLTPGGRARLAVTLGRREGPAGKGEVKVQLVAAEGNLDGFEPVAEATVAPGASAAAFELKARPDAPPVRRTLTALARFSAAPPASAVASPPASAAVRAGDAPR